MARTRRSDPSEESSEADAWYESTECVFIIQCRLGACAPQSFARPLGINNVEFCADVFVRCLILEWHAQRYFPSCSSESSDIHFYFWPNVRAMCPWRGVEYIEHSQAITISDRRTCIRSHHRSLMHVAQVYHSRQTECTCTYSGHDVYTHALDVAMRLKTA